jgi:hypothetical protein
MDVFGTVAVSLDDQLNRTRRVVSWPVSSDSSSRWSISEIGERYTLEVLK